MINKISTMVVGMITTRKWIKHLMTSSRTMDERKNSTTTEMSISTRLKLKTQDKRSKVLNIQKGKFQRKIREANMIMKIMDKSKKIMIRRI